MKRLLSYLKDLYSEASTLLFHILDVLYVVATVAQKDLTPSPWIILVLFVVGLLWGNYKLYLRYKSDILDFSISFLDFNTLKDNLFEIHINNCDNSRIRDTVKKEISNLKLLVEKDKSKRRNNQLFDMGWEFPNTYNISFLDEVDKYEVELQSYLMLLEKINNKLVKFQPSLVNLSNIALNNIRIKFFVNQPIKIPNEEEISYYKAYDFKPNPPIKPDLYKSMDRQLASIIVNSNIGYSKILPEPTSTASPNISGPYFDRTSEVYYVINNLIPKYPEINFEPFYLWFDDVSEKQKIIMPIKLYCSQSSNPISKDIEILIYLDDAIT